MCIICFGVLRVLEAVYPMDFFSVLWTRPAWYQDGSGTVRLFSNSMSTV